MAGTGLRHVDAARTLGNWAISLGTASNSNRRHPYEAAPCGPAWPARLPGRRGSAACWGCQSPAAPRCAPPPPERSMPRTINTPAAAMPDVPGEGTAHTGQQRLALGYDGTHSSIRFPNTGHCCGQGANRGVCYQRLHSRLDRRQGSLIRLPQELHREQGLGLVQPARLNEGSAQAPCFSGPARIARCLCTLRQRQNMPESSLQTQPTVLLSALASHSKIPFLKEPDQTCRVYIFLLRIIAIVTRETVS